MPGTNEATSLDDSSDLASDRLLEPASGERSPANEEEAAGVESDTPGVALGKKVIAGGSWILAVFFLFVVFANGREDHPATAIAGASLVSLDDRLPAPVDSLGLRFDEVRVIWNAVSDDPQVDSVLRRTPEGGALDSFYHRFDSGAELLGAYRDVDDYLVALVVRMNVEHRSLGTTPLHLCHVVSPFTPSCLQAFSEKGLSGMTWEDLAKAGHEATWEFGENEWQVTIEGDQVVMRVISPGSR